MWIAIFKNNEILKQFNNDGSENLFKLVLERLKDLKLFTLIINGIYYTVDLVNGCIYINQNNNIVLQNIPKFKQNIRLIYFKRNIIKINQNEENKQIFYFLGFQYNDKDNKNHKIYLQIDENNNCVINTE